MEKQEQIRHTPLHDEHVRLGARMMPFGGFDMPVQYTGIVEEHMAVRESAGLFDVSHMGEVIVSGPNALQFVQNLVSNDVNTLSAGRALYTVMCRPDGGIVDDLLVYCFSENEYMLVINAANAAQDFAWMQEHNSAGAALQDVSDETALLAIQGPRAIEIVQTLTDLPLSSIKYYHFIQPGEGAITGAPEMIVSRTGYTGEPGLELYMNRDHAVDVWRLLMKAGEPFGLRPAGLGARDTLRLEAGFALYGNDIDTSTTPLQAGLAWLTKLDKGDFIGRDALTAEKAAGIPRRLIGFVLDDRGVPRHGYPITDADGNEIGTVTSGSQSPVLKQGIGLGYVPNEPQFTAADSPIGVSIRGRVLKAHVARPPFFKK